MTTASGGPPEDLAGARLRSAGSERDRAEASGLLAAENAALRTALAEASRARAEAAAIVASSADGILVVDRFQRVITVNPALEQLTGYTAADLQGQACKYLLGATRPDGLSVCDTICPFCQPRLEGRSSTDARVVTKDGREVWVNITYGPIYDGEGRVEAVVHTIRDVSQRKELELAKDRFFSLVNHELKGPLAAAKGYVQLLLRRLQTSWQIDESVPDQLATIDRQLGRIAALVDRMLDVSRAQLGRLALHRTPVDLSELVKRVAEQAQVTAQRHQLELQVESPIDGNWDSLRIEEVLSNLILNAIRYSPRGGVVQVGATVRTGEVLVWVRDQGIGISRTAMQRLFQPYFRSTEAQYVTAEGLGLGLYLSHEIVTAHGGRIWVESEEDRGSTFFFTLPLEG